MRRLWPHGEPLEVWGPADRPEGFHYQHQSHRILDTCNHWQVHTRWWEPDQVVWRDYFKVITDTELLCLLYHDLRSDQWFITQIYD